MDSDKMRAEFEAVARREGWSLRKSKGDPSEYWSEDTGVWWQWWQVAYQTGRKAEREAMQREREEWSKRVNKRWIEMENKTKGER